MPCENFNELFIHSGLGTFFVAHEPAMSNWYISIHLKPELQDQGQNDVAKGLDCTSVTSFLQPNKPLNGWYVACSFNFAQIGIETEQIVQS